MRVLWMAAELDVAFEHVPYEFDDPALKGADFLQLNPAGAVPTIVDDGFALSESLAINLHLARRYGADGSEPLYPSDANGQASAWQWSLWAQGHLEPWVQKDRLLANLIAAIGDRADAMIGVALNTLDRALDGRSWLVGEHFTVADLNVAGVLSPSRAAALDLARRANVAAWHRRCYARPAAAEARRRYGATPMI